MRQILALALAVAAMSPTLVAQDAASEVRKAFESGLAAVRAKDVKAYDRLVADELRWVNGNGSLQTKADRLKAVSAGGDPPPFSDVSVHVMGDVATLIAIQTPANGPRGRTARTYIKRDGRWQLLLHATVPLQ